MNDGARAAQVRKHAGKAVKTTHCRAIASREFFKGNTLSGIS
jgi:hypothetical protein